MHGVTITAPVDQPVIILERWFDAPRELIWLAWTDPARLAEWFGPEGYTVPECRCDLRVGGHHRLVMRSPSGMLVPVVGEYLEIDPPNKLVYSDRIVDHPPEFLEVLRAVRASKGPGESAPEWVVTMTLVAQGGGTQLTLHTEFASIADRDTNLELQMADGWSQSFVRLADLLRPGSEA